MTQKLRYDLITPEMEQALAEVLMEGAKKYSERGWEEQMDTYTAEVHFESVLRHLNEHKYGIKSDHETGLHPLTHAFCRLGMMITVMAREKPNLAQDHKSAGEELGERLLIEEQMHRTLNGVTPDEWDSLRK